MDTPSPLYVGQPISLRLAIPGGWFDCEIDAPRVPNASVYALTGTAPHRSYNFLIVPRVPGPLVIPAQDVRCDDVGWSLPRLPLDIHSPPSAGQTRHFLGGVGRLEAGLAIDAAAAQAGSWITAELTLRGPGALGSIRSPSLFAEQGGQRQEFRLEPLSVVADPPTRTFQARVRLPAGGRWRLAASPIEAFIPESRRYETVRAPSLELDLAAAGVIDIRTIDYARPEAYGSKTFLLALSVALPVAGSLVYVLWRRRSRKPRVKSLAASVSAAMAMLQALDQSSLTPKARAEAIGAIIHQVIRSAQPTLPALLTPQEARSRWQQLTGDPTTGTRVAALLEQCDQLRFSRPDSVSNSACPDPVAETLAILRSIQ